MDAFDAVKVRADRLRHAAHLTFEAAKLALEIVGGGGVNITDERIAQIIDMESRLPRALMSEDSRQLSVDIESALRELVEARKDARRSAYEEEPFFEIYWALRQKRSWERGLMADEKNKPVPAEWGNGFKSEARDAWMARASLHISRSPIP